ncbi:store-operated calcium entry-associated regulatory factor-like isoform X1 [Varroa destructor]|uniref:Store-operated calcium entry-associated regulatory factor n=1 Tax=Varroa destructor TaxID=109461 RepID=A0A7M7M8J1_VARDE|nr:store-operated calcium entry-associated regulatory factor-like isoform X1 [Varroa destructor]XP_022643901.1 store-operated calcium entry-associated regulatory factor-like isoform X1 [Varroa destructor]XP_022643902.1 store-operated calcium entry-associated regulatory factor-like isoform X1 [Varroa destructor]XP_022643903.1 store-operated calcium entry-associated regulatory factor-like isoform X1 [Varroa destructor]XP_022643904.1 store-operated calcium entry-associated regulatory factor-like i
MGKGHVISTAIGVVLLTLVGLSCADEHARSNNGIVNETVTKDPILTALSQISDENRVSIRQINVLTFKAGRLAVRMRTMPPAQLTCLSGCIGELPSSVQCKNEGWDGTSVNWRCEANLQRGRRLENTQVRCEAYPDGDKEYILKGSCALSYSLGGHAGSASSNPSVRHPSSDSPRNKPLQYIVPLIMVAILVVILCAVFKTCMRKRDSAGTIMGPPPEQPIGGGGFYGGGGAYPTQPGFNPGFAHPGMEPRLYQGYSPGYAPPVVAPQPSGGSGSALGAGLGGFAAGAATGGLLGYMMGNRGSDHHHSYSDGGHYGAYGGEVRNDDYGGDGGGGGYEMSTDFADTAME